MTAKKTEAGADLPAAGFDFIGRRRIWLVLSAVLVLVSLVSLGVRGLNLGIDFTGGVTLDLRFDEQVTVGEIRGVLGEFGLASSGIVRYEDGQGVLIRTRELSEPERREVLAAIDSQVAEVQSEDTHLVSPVIARELVRLAFYALLIACGLMLLYISFRFEFKSAVVAITALVHDALITVGMFSLLQIEVSSPFVAAILTVIGYSINDTIVVFDRIRENLKYMRKETMAQMVNRSIRQTLARSINTSATTLLVILAILLLGGRTLREFALALFIGVLIGTCSSIFLAAPLWTTWREREQRQARGGLRRRAS